MYQTIIVEDEDEIRLGLASYLPWAEMGYELVNDFSNGNGAINFLKNNHVDIVITDIRMSGGSGLDVASFLHSHKRLETIVFYTAYEDFEYARKGIEYGVRQYLTKNMGYHELVEALSSIKNSMDTILQPHYNLGEHEPCNDTVINIVRKYMETSYQSLTLDSTAKVARMNPQYLSTYFKEKTGMNFRAALGEIRMRKARELLLSHLYRISEISNMVGYSDTRHFIKCFKSFYGKSPVEYKKELSEGIHTNGQTQLQRPGGKNLFHDPHQLT